MQLKLETDLSEKLKSENNKLKQEVSDKDDQIKAMEEKYEELVRKMSAEEKIKFGLNI